MAILLPIASGKGGAGKTAVAANLGVARAAAGRTVILDHGAALSHNVTGFFLSADSGLELPFDECPGADRG
jgi:MinD-like ATPase involved in chromosome partitioning or flagellar assembly